MTNKEMLLSAIGLKETPRTPVILLSSGVWAAKRQGLSLSDIITLPPETVAEALMKNAREVGVDLIWSAADCNNIVLHALGGKILFGSVGEASSVKEPLLKQLRDIDKIDLDFIEKSPEIANLLRVTELLHEKSGGEYLIGVSQWGPFTLAGLLYGIENLMMLAIRDKKGLKVLMDFAETVILRYLKLFQACGAELVCLAEPAASGDMISAKLFETTVLPHLKSVYQQIDSNAKMLHICGNTTKILHLIPETGATLYSFDHKVPVAIAAEKLSGKIAFAGQLDPVAVILEGIPETVYAEAERCIRSAGLAPGYVLMPGCDLPPKTKLENVIAIKKAAYETKKEI